MSVVHTDHFCDCQASQFAEPPRSIHSLTQHPLMLAVSQCSGYMQGTKEDHYTFLLKCSIPESHGLRSRHGLDSLGHWLLSSSMLCLP